VLETELTAAGIPHGLKVYPGAKHAFFNDQWREQVSDNYGRVWMAGILLRNRRSRLPRAWRPAHACRSAEHPDMRES
jgi:dienelactone hydrolase